MDPTKNGNDQAIKFASRLENPVLTDINIDWGELNPEHLTPSHLPNLFAGDSIRIQGKFKANGKREISITGRVNGRRVELSLKLNPDVVSGACL